MPFPWMAAATAGGALLSYFGARNQNEANVGQAQATSAFNAKQAQLNRKFQKQMSDTQWQRGVADMKKAGLNPMLAYSQGGASSPGGSVATGVTPHIENQLGASAQGFREAALLLAEIDLKRAQTADAEASAKMKSFPANISTTASDVVDKVKGGARETADKVMDTVMPKIEGVSSAVSSVAKEVKEKVEATVEVIRRLPEKAQEKVETMMLNSADSVKRFAEDLKSNIKSGVGRTYRDIAPAFKRSHVGKRRGTLGGASPYFGLGAGPY